MLKLSKKEVSLLIDIVAQCELFSNPKIENCKSYYSMTQKAAKKKADKILNKLHSENKLL